MTTILDLLEVVLVSTCNRVRGKEAVQCREIIETHIAAVAEKARRSAAQGWSPISQFA